MSRKDRYQTPRGWTLLTGDVNWDEYGATWARKGPDGAWYVVTFANMEEALDEREFKSSGLCRYEAAVKRVDLRTAPAEQVKGALESCGLSVDPAADFNDEGEPIPGIVGNGGNAITDPAQVESCIVECLVGFGGGAPLGDETGNGWPLRVRKAGMRLAESYMRDEHKRAAALARPVNRIGSTAEEYGHGDVWSAMRRDPSDPLISVLRKCYRACEGHTLGGVKVPDDISGLDERRAKAIAMAQAEVAAEIKRMQKDARR